MIGTARRIDPTLGHRRPRASGGPVGWGLQCSGHREA